MSSMAAPLALKDAPPWTSSRRRVPASFASWRAEFTARPRGTPSLTLCSERFARRASLGCGGRTGLIAQGAFEVAQCVGDSGCVRGDGQVLHPVDVDHGPTVRSRLGRALPVGSGAQQQIGAWIPLPPR